VIEHQIDSGVGVQSDRVGARLDLVGGEGEIDVRVNDVLAAAAD